MLANFIKVESIQLCDIPRLPGHKCESIHTYNVFGLRDHSTSLHGKILHVQYFSVRNFTPVNSLLPGGTQDSPTHQRFGERNLVTVLRQGE
jgi:hypothetical protein